MKSKVSGFALGSHSPNPKYNSKQASSWKMEINRYRITESKKVFIRQSTKSGVSTTRRSHTNI